MQDDRRDFTGRVTLEGQGRRDDVILEAVLAGAVADTFLFSLILSRLLAVVNDVSAGAREATVIPRFWISWRALLSYLTAPAAESGTD